MKYGGEGVGLSGASSSLAASTLRGLLLALCTVALSSAQTPQEPQRYICTAGDDLSATAAAARKPTAIHVAPLEAGQRVTLDARWVGGDYCRMTANGYERAPRYWKADCAKFYRELYLADRMAVMICWAFDSCSHWNQHRGYYGWVMRDPWCLPDGVFRPDGGRCVSRQMRHRSGG